MGSLAALLGSFATSLGSRVLTSLGLGFISFAGYSTVVGSLVTIAVNNWGGITGDILAYFTLAGFPQGFGIILGCVVTRSTLSLLSTIGKVA